MLRLILFLLTLISGIYFSNAQQITARIIDSQTNESIPFATIRIGETDLISNEDGYFTLSGENTNEATLMAVSFIGYNPKQVSVSQLKQNNNIIILEQGYYDIGAVYVSNVKPDPNQIMKLVNDNLSKNYTNSDYKFTLFTRETQIFKPKKLEIEITKSTGFSKSDLKNANEDIRKLTSSVTSNPPQDYTDKLMNYYKASKTTEGKTQNIYKAEVLKATKLKDEKRSTNFDDLEKTVTNLFLKHLDTTKFYRVKSGLFGSRDTISFNKEFNEKKRAKREVTKTEEKKHLNSAKASIMSFIGDNSFFKNSRLDFVSNTEIYTYSYLEATYLGDDLVYVIDFKPKKKKAKYTGKLYISEADYAVIRADYKLGEGKKLESLNLKLLLGVKMAEDVSNGTLIFKKNPHNNVYHLHYASQESGQYFYVNRPVKFIELAKSDKDVVALNFKVEGNNIDKTEYLNIGTKPSNEKEVNDFQEKEFEYQILKKYDPSIWKGYNIIEPLEEMKKFEVIEE